MPTYNVGIGIYNRDNGIDPLEEEVPIDIDGDGVVSDIPCTEENWNTYPEIQSTCDELGAGENAWDENIFYTEEALSTQLYQPERTRTSQYTLSVNSPFEYIFKHNISFNIFYSDKKDLIEGIVNKPIDEYIEEDNNDYYSSSSSNNSYNLGIRTTYNKRVESSLGLNYTYYSYGYENHSYHPEYFQEQKIYMADIRFFYDTLSWMGTIDPGVNLSIGNGSSNNFNQITLKIGSKIQIIENLNFIISLNSKFKFVEDDNEEIEFYNDYSGYIHLKYKF